VSFAVEGWVLPWRGEFCRGGVGFAVAGVGRRTYL